MYFRVGDIVKVNGYYSGVGTIVKTQKSRSYYNGASQNLTVKITKTNIPERMDELEGKFYHTSNRGAYKPIMLKTKTTKGETTRTKTPDNKKIISRLKRI